MNQTLFTYEFSAVLKYQPRRNLRFKTQIIMDIVLKTHYNYVNLYLKTINGTFKLR